MASSLNSIVSVLEREFGLILQRQSPTAPFQFDALLRSPVDPMPLFIVEDFSLANDRSIKEKCRRLESFIWNLYRAGNVNTIAAVFITGERAADELLSVAKRFSNIGRLFLVNRNFTRDELLATLGPLVPPKLTEIETEKEQFESVVRRSEDIIQEMSKTPVIGIWIRQKTSVQELKHNISNEFERLMKELQNAIK